MQLFAACNLMHSVSIGHIPSVVHVPVVWAGSKNIPLMNTYIQSYRSTCPARRAWFRPVELSMAQYARNHTFSINSELAVCTGKGALIPIAQVSVPLQTPRWLPLLSHLRSHFPHAAAVPGQHVPTRRRASIGCGAQSKPCGWRRESPQKRRSKHDKNRMQKCLACAHDWKGCLE